MDPNDYPLEQIKFLSDLSVLEYGYNNVVNKEKLLIQLLHNYDVHFAKNKYNDDERIKTFIRDRNVYHELLSMANDEKRQTENVKRDTLKEYNAYLKNQNLPTIQP